MGTGLKKHLKRFAAPRSWMLDKLGGVFAPRPMRGGHKLKQSIPIILIIRNRLKYALNYKEAKKIVSQRLIKVDNKTRTDSRFPAGFMDVVSINKTNETFRILYDTKGRFVVHRITAEEGKFKLCRVQSRVLNNRATPCVITHDGRTIRFPDPRIKVNDTVVLDLENSKITDFVKFEPGNLCMVTGGHNMGRVGVIVQRDHHPGSFDIIHIKDAAGHTFSTRMKYVFVIGKGTKALISLPSQKGIRLSIIEERDKRIATKQGH